MYMPGMNSPEAQYQLAMKMPDASLASILKGMPGAIDQSVAMMVLGQRQRMKTASQGQQAGAEAQQPSVKDRMVQSQQGQLPENQGIGTLRSDNMGKVADVAMGAQGGVVGFAGGGDVQHFLTGGDMELRKERAKKYNAALKGEQYVPPYEAYVAEPGQMGISKEDILNTYPAEEGLTQLAGPQMNSPAAATTLPVSIGRPRGDAAPVSASGIKLLPTQPALPMTDYSTSPDVPASPSAAAKPATADSAEDIKALAPVSSFAATQGIMNASTQPYMDEMNKLAKGISLNEGEKESQKYTRAGTALLTFSEQLLASGRPGASSVGAAFGKMGALAQEYAKEDSVARRADIGSKMSLLGAQVQVAQGNTKNAIELFHHAEQMAFKDIEFRTNTKIKNEELRLKELGIFNEKDFRNQTIKYHNDQILEQREWHKAHEPLLRAQAGLAGAHAGYYGAAGAQNKLIIALAGQMRTADTKLAAQPGAAGTAAKARLADEKGYADMARRQLGFETLGLGALEPKSVQLDSVDPANVLKVK
jgi:hypothetical protein